MIVTNKTAIELREQKVSLMLSRDKGEISEKVYVKKYREVYEKHYKRIQELINQSNSGKVVEEEVRNVIIKFSRKPKKNSMALLIENALALSEVKSEGDVIRSVLKINPDKEDRNIRLMTRNIINQVIKQQQPRWKGYVWKQDEYLLVKPV